MFRILVVDDEYLMRYSLSVTLKGPGIGVRSAENGREAIRAIREERFDICILDLHLPDLGGEEILRVLSSESPCTKVIVMSGDLMDRETRETVRKHAVWFLEKPFSLDMVKSFVDLIIRRISTAVEHGAGQVLPQITNVDRRRNARREADKLVVYTAVAPDGATKVFNVEATLMDVSDSGLGLVTHHPVEPGWIMTLFDGEIINQGVVRWKAAASPDAGFRIGVKFSMIQ